MPKEYEAKFLEVDVEEMDIGDSVFLSALKLPEGVEIPILALGEDRDQAVVSVTEAKVIEIEPEIVESEDEEGEEGEEGEGSEDSESTEGDSE